MIRQSCLFLRNYLEAAQTVNVHYLRHVPSTLLSTQNWGFDPSNSPHLEAHVRRTERSPTTKHNHSLPSCPWTKIRTSSQPNSRARARSRSSRFLNQSSNRHAGLLYLFLPLPLTSFQDVATPLVPRATPFNMQHTTNYTPPTNRFYHTRRSRYASTAPPPAVQHYATKSWGQYCVWVWLTTVPTAVPRR